MSVNSHYLCQGDSVFTRVCLFVVSLFLSRIPQSLLNRFAPNLEADQVKGLDPGIIFSTFLNTVFSRHFRQYMALPDVSALQGAVLVITPNSTTILRAGLYSGGHKESVV